MMAHLQNLPASHSVTWAKHVKPAIIWKPALLKKLDMRRRRLDAWISQGKFPAPDGVKHSHPWWYVSTVETWLASE